MWVWVFCISYPVNKPLYSNTNILCLFSPNSNQRMSQIYNGFAQSQQVGFNKTPTTKIEEYKIKK